MKAIITGASSGIGLEFAKLFAQDGYDLILVARREEKLQQIAKELQSQFNISVKVYGSDLSKENSAMELYTNIKKEGKAIDVLINNAGFGERGEFFEIPLKSQQEMIHLNISSLMELSYLFGNEMKRRKSGAILNVSSTASFQPGPYMAVYFATKAFVTSFSEALFEELKPFGVSVTALCPGATITGFAKRAHITNAFSFEKGAMSAKTVAELGYRALKKKTPLYITGFVNQVAYVLSKFAPRSFGRKIVANMFRDKDK